VSNTAMDFYSISWKFIISVDMPDWVWTFIRVYPSSESSLFSVLNTFRIYNIEQSTGLKYSEIIKCLEELHGYIIGIRTLKRITKKFWLYRRKYKSDIRLKCEFYRLKYEFYRLKYELYSLMYEFYRLKCKFYRLKCVVYRIKCKILYVDSFSGLSIFDCPFDFL
jgi:hypothetical protein